MGFGPATVDQAADVMMRLYDLFVTKDSTLIEINPMTEDLLGRGNIEYFLHYFYSHSMYLC